MQVDVTSEKEQQTVARIAGALAHELNNPLQGVISLLKVTLRESRSDERCHARLEQIHQGVSRLSRTVESLSAIYENLPRPPDSIPLPLLLSSMADSLTESGFVVRAQAVKTNTLVRCFAPEFVRLVTDLFREHTSRGSRLHLVCRQSSSGAEAVCELDRGNKSAANGNDWLKLDEVSGMSGLAVLIDEMTKLANGTVEFAWRDAELSGVRLGMRSA